MCVLNPLTGAGHLGEMREICLERREPGGVKDLGWRLHLDAVTPLVTFEAVGVEAAQGNPVVHEEEMTG